MRTWAGELDMGAATGEHGSTHWERKETQAITDYNGEKKKKSDKQKLQIGQKIKPVGGGVASEQVRDGVKDPRKGTVY